MRDHSTLSDGYIAFVKQRGENSIAAHQQTVDTPIAIACHEQHAGELAKAASTPHGRIAFAE